MSIEKQWETMSRREDADLSAMINQSMMQNDTSKDPLVILKKNILGNTAWAVLIAIGYLVVLIKYPFWPILLCIGVTFLFTCIGAFTNVQLYQKINKKHENNSLLQEMERHYFTITAWIKNQERAMLLVYPVAAVGGFMLGLTIFSDKPIEEIMQKTTSVVSLIILTALFVPAGYITGKYLNRKAFGRYCDQLKDNIDALRTEK